MLKPGKFYCVPDRCMLAYPSYEMATRAADRFSDASYNAFSQTTKGSWGWANAESEYRSHLLKCKVRLIEPKELLFVVNTRPSMLGPLYVHCLIEETPLWLVIYEIADAKIRLVEE